MKIIPVILIRYWFQFVFDTYKDLPPGMARGCGITAYSYDDALNILKSKVFKEEWPLKIKQVTENIDVSTLDEGHVLPNMTHPLKRGIWFPLGYD